MVRAVVAVALLGGCDGSSSTSPHGAAAIEVGTDVADVEPGLDGEAIDTACVTCPPGDYFIEIEGDGAKQVLRKSCATSVSVRRTALSTV